MKRTVTSTAIAFRTPYNVNASEIAELSDLSRLTFDKNEYGTPDGWIKVGSATITVEFDEVGVIRDEICKPLALINEAAA